MAVRVGARSTRYVGGVQVRSGTAAIYNKSKAGGLGIDSADSYQLKFNSNGTVKTLADLTTAQTFAGKVMTFTGVPQTNGLVYVNSTVTSATPGSVRAMVGSANVPATLTTGTIVGVRGVVTIPTSGTVATGCNLYGVQGKLITGTGTVTAGSGEIAAIFGQLDMTGGTLTSGNIAVISANVVGLAGGTSTVFNAMYVEHAGGGVINSYLRCFGKASYVFEFESNVYNLVMKTSSTTTANVGTSGWLKVHVEGVDRYIPLASAVT